MFVEAADFSLHLYEMSAKCQKINNLNYLKVSYYFSLPIILNFNESKTTILLFQFGNPSQNLSKVKFGKFSIFSVMTLFSLNHFQPIFHFYIPFLNLIVKLHDPFFTLGFTFCKFELECSIVGTKKL